MNPMQAMKYSPTLLLLFIATSLSIQVCDKPKTEYRKHALAYFYGEDKAGIRTAGKMISSYGKKERDTAIELRKVIYGLNKELIFLSEGIRVMEINETEFLIVYTIAFKHTGNNHYYNIEEHYYSVPDVYHDPVPLKVTQIKANLSTKEGHLVREHTLWHGDFDAYLGRHLKKSVFPE